MWFGLLLLCPYNLSLLCSAPVCVSFSPACARACPEASHKDHLSLFLSLPQANNAARALMHGHAYACGCAGEGNSLRHSTVTCSHGQLCLCGCLPLHGARPLCLPWGQEQKLAVLTELV